MKRVATEIADQEPRIDVLINNAGAIFSTRQLTEDDLERTFAVNHMAYFVLASRATGDLRCKMGRAEAWDRPRRGHSYRLTEAIPLWSADREVWKLVLSVNDERHEAED